MKTEDGRRYLPPPRTDALRPSAEDLHAWSIYRQNITSEISNHALAGKQKTTALPYGNFNLRPNQVDAILNRVKGTSSEFIHNTGTSSYLKYGLPRVHSGNRSPGAAGSDAQINRHHHGSHAALRPSRKNSESRAAFDRNSRLRKSRSEADIRARRVSASHVPVEIDWRPHAGQRQHSRERDLHHLPAALRSPSEGDVYKLQNYRGGMQRSLGSYELPYSVSYREISRTPDGRYRSDHQLRNADTEDVTDRARPSSRASREAAPANAYFVKATGSLRVRREPLESEQSDTQTTVSVLQDHPGRNAQHFGYAEGPPKEDFTRPLPPIIVDSQYYGQFDDEIRPSSAFNRMDYPPFSQCSLQVRNLSLIVEDDEKQPKYSFSSLTFEARAGELVGIMATTPEQGDNLLQCLMNRKGRWSESLKGAINLNGLDIEPKRLAKRAVYAGTNLDFNPDMSLKQTMLFASHLAEPGEVGRSLDTKGRIEALIGDLGLSNVSATSVGELTRSEKQRLNIACQLLADPDIVLLDRPTHNMDIFDTFFLIEYLRQWALRGRIVIMTIQPPTFEIFNMLSKVILLADGRTIYSGRRKEMVTYFQDLEYPCPSQKNPADYYLDLVSVDDTSVQAHEESIQRIDYLASLFNQRPPLLSEPEALPYLPPEVQKAGFCWQIIALWIRALIFMFPYNLIEALHQIVQNVGMSVMLGIVYFGLNRNQASVDDRAGLLYVLLAVCIWPIIIHIMQRDFSAKRWLHKDLEDRAYSKIAFLCAKFLYSAPITLISIGAYSIPVYFMTRLRQDDSFVAFGVYVGLMFLHTITWRSFAKLCVYVCPSPKIAAVPLGILAFLSFLTSGYLVHSTQLFKVFKWFEWISPTQWTFSELTRSEFNGVDRFDCLKIPVQIGGLPILTSPSCGIENGRQAISFWHLLGRNTNVDLWKPFVAVALFDIGLFLLAAVGFLLIAQRPVRKPTEVR